MNDMFDDLLMGERLPSWTAREPGASITGIVTRKTVSVQRHYPTGHILLWHDGNARHQLVVTLDTGGTDGLCELYVKIPSNLQRAVSLGVRAAGFTTLNVGDILTVTMTGFTADGQTKAYDAKVTERLEYGGTV